MSHEQTHDRVRRWVRLPASAEEVWAVVGGFGAVADWHPSVSESPVFEMEGETCRHLALSDGGLFLDALREQGPTSYRYAVMDGPAALGEARGAFSAVAEPDGGCHVYWSLDFEPADAAADAIVAGLIESGLEALRARWGAAG
mgnify:CR=1 FL=1